MTKIFLHFIILTHKKWIYALGLIFLWNCYWECVCFCAKLSAVCGLSVSIFPLLFFWCNSLFSSPFSLLFNHNPSQSRVTPSVLEKKSFLLISSPFTAKHKTPFAAPYTTINMQYWFILSKIELKLSSKESRCNWKNKQTIF